MHLHGMMIHGMISPISQTSRARTCRSFILSSVCVQFRVSLNFSGLNQGLSRRVHRKNGAGVQRPSAQAQTDRVTERSNHRTNRSSGVTSGLCRARRFAAFGRRLGPRMHMCTTMLNDQAASISTPSLQSSPSPLLTVRVTTSRLVLPPETSSFLQLSSARRAAAGALPWPLSWRKVSTSDLEGICQCPRSAVSRRRSMRRPLGHCSRHGVCEHLRSLLIKPRSPPDDPWQQISEGRKWKDSGDGWRERHLCY